MEVDKRKTKIDVVDTGEEVVVLAEIHLKKEAQQEIGHKIVIEDIKGVRIPVIVHNINMSPSALASIISEEKGFAFAIFTGEKPTETIIAKYVDGNEVERKRTHESVDEAVVRLFQNGYTIHKALFGYVAEPQEETAQLATVGSFI